VAALNTDNSAGHPKGLESAGPRGPRLTDDTLTAGSAVVAVTAYAIAERVEQIAPHINHAAVGEILKKAKVDEFLKSIGVWN